MDKGFGTSGVLVELSCSRFRWVIMLEKVLVGCRGECLVEASLTGNEGAGRGRENGDMVVSVCCDGLTICECVGKSEATDWGSRKRSLLEVGARGSLL